MSGVGGRSADVSGSGNSTKSTTAGTDAATSAQTTNIEPGLSAIEAKSRLTRLGPNAIPEKARHPISRFLRKFWGLSAWMIELITLLSFALHKYTDLTVALALLLINAVLSFFQEERASTAVEALRSRLQVSARVLRDGVWGTCPARELVDGDVVRVRSGDFVPADIRVIDGSVQIDQSALTGESAQAAKKFDDTVYSGSIVTDGEVTGIVVATGTRTYFGRTTELVESAHPKLHIEGVIARVVRWLFAIVGTLVAIAIAVSLAERISLLEILPLSLVLLMSAIPVALPVMFTVSMAVGSIALARKGVLVTRLSAAEDAANLDVLCADKTGTLTLNRLGYAGAIPQRGFTDDAIIRFGALASNAANADPIDLAFLRAASDHGLASSGDTVVSFTPFSAKTRKTMAVVNHGVRTTRVEKGALRTIAKDAGLDLSEVAVLEAQAAKAAANGFRVIAVAAADGEEPLRLMGLALLEDAPRPDSANLIRELQTLGVTVKMLTGDALPVAQQIARELGLGPIARVSALRAAKDGSDAQAPRLAVDASGYAEVFPEDKFQIVQSLQSSGHVVGMTGDGVNDAPALRQAEVGIAVSGATDVAKGAASVVLTTEGLSGIVDLVTNGRAIYQRVLTWIVNKISRTILKAGFVVAAFLVTGKFVISALGMVLVVFMTDFVKIALSTDNVRPSQKPQTWKIGPLVRAAIVIGLLMLIEALTLLAYGWHRFALAGHAGELQTFSFQTLLFFALCSIVSVRERRAFWASRPSIVLAVALAADGVAGLLIGYFGLADLRPIAPAQTALILSYALVCSLVVNDAAKRALFQAAL